MAGRKPKVGLDYASWNCNVFDGDQKIDKLLDAQGWVGFGIYFFLCNRAYATNGYFYEWGYDDCATTARKMGGGIGSTTVRETVNYCLQIGLFDKRLFDGWHILTSRGIQKMYCIAINGRDVKRVISEYWLLREDENCKGLLKLPKNPENKNFQEENSNFQDGNSNFQTQSKVKNSKVKNSKVNTISTELSYDTSEHVISLTLNDKSEYPIHKDSVEKWMELYPAVDILQSLRDMKGWLDANPRNRKTKSGINKFINAWLARNQNSARKESERKKDNNSFNNFQQNTYDYDALLNDLKKN